MVAYFLLIVPLKPPANWQRFYCASLVSTTPGMHALPVSLRPVKLALPVSATPAKLVTFSVCYWPVSTTPVRHDVTVSTTPVRNASPLLLIPVKCVQKPNLFYTELFLYQTYYILNLFYSELTK
jgi:hypothetical protein